MLCDVTGRQGNHQGRLSTCRTTALGLCKGSGTKQLTSMCIWGARAGRHAHKCQASQQHCVPWAGSMQLGLNLKCLPAVFASACEKRHGRAAWPDQAFCSSRQVGGSSACL